MDITDQYDQIVRCNRCGFCQTACPIFRSTGHEAGVARGRLALLRAIVEGRVEWSSDLKEPLFACLLCGACTAHCFPAVPTADLITAARGQFLQKVGRSRLHKLLFHRLLPYPGRLRLAARAAALGKKAKLSSVAKALGLLRIFGRDFPRAEEIVERFPARAFRDRVKAGRYDGHGDALHIAYFVGCGMDIMTPDAAEASLELLKARGKTVTVLPNCCCGLPAETYGDREAALSLARKNLQCLGAAPYDLVVTDCSSCASFLKKYPTLFPEADPLRREAEKLASRTRDVVQFLAASCSSSRITHHASHLVVTWHDPCHASRGQKLVKEPRDILKSLPGVEYRELPEADWCCGGAGSYALGHYDLARQVLDRKMDNVVKTGANVLVTSCPACIIQLSYGVRLRKLPVRVCHLSELLVYR
ncbi:MAG TPA: (Fe-S)-binding protein [Planctomycetota bacterium]|nr:(Fe-S)-binding protein [Planctomycetota bacterium]HRR82497.1 (Fe-S)-binding protein [Planctomycetota bacterium]HRT95905.1 (Fe-S)-binding protein [Planctomycetota bacterium]